LGHHTDKIRRLQHCIHFGISAAQTRNLTGDGQSNRDFICALAAAESRCLIREKAQVYPAGNAQLLWQIELDSQRNSTRAPRESKRGHHLRADRCTTSRRRGVKATSTFSRTARNRLGARLNGRGCGWRRFSACEDNDAKQNVERTPAGALPQGTGRLAIVLA
jgi:hypothetical protein